MPIYAHHQAGLAVLFNSLHSLRDGCSTFLPRLRGNTPGDLLLVLPHDWRKSAAGVLMVIHLMVTYTISQQVLSRAICAYLLPEALQDGIVARFKWFFVTSGMMAACFLVANLIPLFQERSCEMNVWKLKLPTSTGASFGLTIP